MALESTELAPALVRVGIVDDHRIVVDGIAAHLGANAPDLEVVIRETTWVGLIGHSAFPVDVVVLDLNLDDEIAIGAKVRTLSSIGTYTVVVSRHADVRAVHGALKSGALAFVPKTESADELILAIRSAALGKRYPNPLFTAALAVLSTTAEPRLGKQERRALVLYAAGRSIREVALAMDTTDETVKSYIKRGRRKYREAGIDLGTKFLLRQHGIGEGWLTPE